MSKIQREMSGKWKTVLGILLYLLVNSV